MEQHSCLSFAIDCDVLWKGLGVTIAGFILFVGSVYLLLAAIFGRWMGYLVLAVAFFGWMTIQSGLWLFGFWSQGPDTKTNLGPRGPDATWVVDAAGLDPGAVHEELAAYPSGEYPEPDTSEPGGGGGRPTGAGCRRRLHGQAGQRAARARPDRVRLDPVHPDGGR